MSKNEEEKPNAAAAAPPAGLFGEDSSSSDEELAPAPASAGGGAGENTDRAADRPDAMDADETDGPKKDGGAEEKQSKKKVAKNAALFGDDDDDSSDDDDDDEEAATTPATAKASDSTAQPSASAATTTTPKANSALFGDEDSSEDDADAELTLDDVQGRAATDAERAAMAHRAEILAQQSANAGIPGREPQPSEERERMLPGSTGGREGHLLEEAPRQKPPRRLEVLDIPRPADIHRAPEGKVSLHVTKLPNLVGIQAQPYDPDTYDPEQEDIDYKGYTHSMIRWRYKKGTKEGEYGRDANGKLLRESNARFVKWSDGSYTLHVGPEVFEVDQIGAPKAQTKVMAKAGTPAAMAATAAAKSGKSGKQMPGHNGYLYLTQTIRAASSELDSTPLPRLVDKTILECHGPITSRLVPRPSSLQSAAHKNLTLAVRQRNMKKAKIAEIVTIHDPELVKQQRIRNKDDLEKQKARKRAKGEGRGGRRGGGGTRAGMNRRYLEEDDDDRYDTVNVSRMKKSDNLDDYDYGTSSGESEDEWSKRKGLGGRQRRAAAHKKQVAAEKAAESSSEEEFMDFGDDDDDDEDNVMMAKRGKGLGGGKKRTHQAIADDDDE